MRCIRSSPSTKTRTRPGTAATASGQLGQRQGGLLQRAGLLDTRSGRRQRRRGDARQLLRLGHQRDRANTPRTRTCSSPAPTANSKPILDDERRPVVLERRRATNRWAAFTVGGLACDMTFDMSGGMTPVGHHELRSRPTRTCSPRRAGCRARATDRTRSRTNSPRCASISRASSKAASEMVSSSACASPKREKDFFRRHAGLSSALVPGQSPGVRSSRTTQRDGVRCAAAAERQLRRNRRLRLRRHAGG